jgi:hypothetical protein
MRSCEPTGIAEQGHAGGVVRTHRVRRTTGGAVWAVDVADGMASLLVILLLNHGQTIVYLPGLTVNRASALPPRPGKDRRPTRASRRPTLSNALRKSSGARRTHGWCLGYRGSACSPGRSARAAAHPVWHRAPFVAKVLDLVGPVISTDLLQTRADEVSALPMPSPTGFLPASQPSSSLSRPPLTRLPKPTSRSPRPTVALADSAAAAVGHECAALRWSQSRPPGGPCPAVRRPARRCLVTRRVKVEVAGRRFREETLAPLRPLAASRTDTASPRAVLPVFRDVHLQ